MEKLFNIGDLDLIRDVPIEIETLLKKNQSLRKALIVVGSIGLIGFGIWIYREFFNYRNDERGK
jgi:hypothetical protein